ncbi:DNA-methyltransferase [Streptomyces sp. NPDC016172]|uniref:DNA-methyltransferase n=1 Tax=Streptomyces sp. NPDC016172 TaxID=3364964 RepID=UPI0036F620D3
MAATNLAPAGQEALIPVEELTGPEPVVHCANSLELLPTLPDASVDAIVTDPPYELGFLGKSWDASGIAYNVDLWAECLRVLKPGGHLAAFGATRNYHRMTVAIEDAGFEIRDSLHWLYGSGFPKSLDVSKAIDKAAGAEREVIGPPPYRRGRAGQSYSDTRRTSYDYQPQPLTAAATEDAARWEGWTTALKPGHEPIVLARKPLEGTVASNVLEYGTGAMNTAACKTPPGDPEGRWPTNVLLSHAWALDADGWIVDGCTDGCVEGCPVAELDRQSGLLTSGANPRRRGADKFRDVYGDFKGQTVCKPIRGADSGGASRFYPAFRYQAKAPTSERPRLPDGTVHPTVKPVALMRWLVRLLTPPGGLVLDPFAGTGTTLEAARLEGFDSMGVEEKAEYAKLCRLRLRRDTTRSA